jgi:hypothetical protein
MSCQAFRNLFFILDSQLWRLIELLNGQDRPIIKVTFLESCATCFQLKFLQLLPLQECVGSSSNLFHSEKRGLSDASNGMVCYGKPDGISFLCCSCDFRSLFLETQFLYLYILQLLNISFAIAAEEIRTAQSQRFLRGFRAVRNARTLPMGRYFWWYEYKSENRIQICPRDLSLDSAGEAQLLIMRESLAVPHGQLSFNQVFGPGCFESLLIINSHSCLLVRATDLLRIKHSHNYFECLIS